MFIKEIILSMTLVLVLSDSLTQSETLAITKQKIFVTMCKTKECKIGIDGSRAGLNVSFQCRSIHRSLRRHLTWVNLQSSPKFATCIVLYNGEHCTGQSLKVNGTKIDIASASQSNSDFDKSMISSYELCSTNELRLDAIQSVQSHLKTDLNIQTILA